RSVEHKVESGLSKQGGDQRERRVNRVFARDDQNAADDHGGGKQIKEKPGCDRRIVACGNGSCWNPGRNAPVICAHSSVRMATTAVRIRRARPVGRSTFHPTFMSWSK